MNPILSIRGLRHSFPRPGRGRGEAQVLRGVDLDLRPGECLGLVGESGAGKTTLARAILRLFEPDHGSVRFEGREVLTMTRGELMEFRSRVQIVFQDPFGSLNPRQRAGRMLEEVLRMHGGPAEAGARAARVREILERVELPASAAERYPHEFSGGQRQRLGIARALAVGPEILILDEPVSALDLSVQAQILNLLEELRSELELTFLFVSHDLSVVRQVSERVAVLYAGRVVEEGRTTDLFQDPLHPYTQGLLTAAASPLPGDSGEGSRGTWSQIEGESPSPFDPPTGCALNPRCPHPLKDGGCSREVPPMDEWKGDHKVACWKVGKHPGNP